MVENMLHYGVHQHQERCHVRCLMSHTDYNHADNPVICSHSLKITLEHFLIVDCLWVPLVHGCGLDSRPLLLSTGRIGASAFCATFGCGPATSTPGTTGETRFCLSLRPTSYLDVCSSFVGKSST